MAENVENKSKRDLVPQNVDGQGLDVLKYEAGDESDRLAKVRELAEQRDDVRFSVGEGEEGGRLNGSEADTLLSQMEEHAEVVPMLELTPENWEKEFGKSNTETTPIGNVKLGENQYKKLVERKRGLYFGMIKPTLERPDIILEEYDPKEGAERDTKYLFVKTFTKPDGGRVVHFESVTVKKEGLEVSISSHELPADEVKEKMQNDNILHLNSKLPFSSEWPLTKAPQGEGPDLVPTSSNSGGKGNNTSENTKGNGENLRKNNGQEPETRFSIGDTASTLGRNLGKEIDVTDEGRREQDRYILDPETGKISLVSKNNRTAKDAERSGLP